MRRKEKNTNLQRRKFIKSIETTLIKLSNLHPYSENPFHVTDNTDMEMLIDSIKSSGIIEPLIVRPDGDKYEIISGHRRFYACKKLGITEVPCFVSDMTKEQAIITLVDANLYRDGLLPSEKAFAYRMKNEALYHSGKRFRQDGERFENTITQIANMSKDSERTIQRYIRLTYLIPELLKLVDEKKIALTPAVEISYIPPEHQQELLITIESEQAVPSLSQAQRMRKLAESGNLDSDKILEIMCERKCNQREPLKIPLELLDSHFAKGVTPQRMLEIIDKALTLYAKEQSQIKTQTKTTQKQKRKDYER